jgi:poly(hydroxyalkanoate) granule-associated protein
MSEAQVLDTVRETGRRVWLAGLGAVGEVGKEGRALFDRLVERGRPLEDKQKKVAADVKERTTKVVREAQKLVGDTVGYETRGIFKRLGLMTREDLTVLTARVESLSKRIDEILTQQEVAAATAAETETTDNDASLEAPAQAAPRPRKKAAR